MSEPPLRANLPVPAEAVAVPEVITVEQIVAAPEANAQVSYLSLELESKQAEVDNLDLQNQQLRNDIADRHSWGNRIFGIMIGWLVVVMAIVTAQGFGIHGFHLDNSIVAAFIGSTTVDVLGLGYIVVNYLFKKPE